MDSIRAVLVGGYSRIYAVLAIADVRLFLVDRAEARSLAVVLELQDALARGGLFPLPDSRLTAP